MAASHDPRSVASTAPNFDRRRFLLAGGSLVVTGLAVHRAWGQELQDIREYSSPLSRSDTSRFMFRAIANSRKAMELGDGGPFGCVIAMGGTIVAEGWSHTRSQMDPTAHGEILAIRKACEYLGAGELEGCDLFASCEPCPMCLGAVYLAKMGRIYYGTSATDATEIGFDYSSIYEQFAKPAGERSIPETQVYRPQAQAVFNNYADDQRRRNY